jgi:hypothetical protein
VRKPTVTLYIREHGTQRYKRAKKDKFPEGTIFILRYALRPRRYRWETLKTCKSYGEAEVERSSRELEILRGKVLGKNEPKRDEKARPRPAQAPATDKTSPQNLDVLLDEYLSRGKFEGTGEAAEKDWRPRTLRAYSQAVMLFIDSARPKSRLDEIDGEDLKRFKIFLRQRKTSTAVAANRRRCTLL